MSFKNQSKSSSTFPGHGKSGKQSFHINGSLQLDQLHSNLETKKVDSSIYDDDFNKFTDKGSGVPESFT